MYQKIRDRIAKKIYFWEGSVMGPWAGVGNLPDDSSGGHPIAEVIKRFLNWFLYIFGFLAIISFIIAGFLYFTAQGDPRQIERAKKATLYGVIGIVVGLIGLIAITTIDSLLRGGAGPTGQ